jgi:hypothetical protein
MNKIHVNIDTLLGYHDVKVVISRDGKVLVDMPGVEFIGWLEVLMNHQDLCKATKSS